MLRWRLPAADLAERYARVLEVEVLLVLSELFGGLGLTLGELSVGEHVARPERLGALQRDGVHVAARPLAFEIRIPPRRSRRTIPAPPAAASAAAMIFCTNVCMNFSRT
jgi:hypothetical protein